MIKIREIAKVRKSAPTIEGAGVHLKRAFGFSQVPEFDPSLRAKVPGSGILSVFRHIPLRGKY